MSEHGARLDLSFGGRATEPVLSALRESAASVSGFGTDVPATLVWARSTAMELGDDVGCAEMWSVLAQSAALDVAAARMLEPHLDALSILADARQVGLPVELEAINVDSGSATWGVFAAESSGTRVFAHRVGDAWVLEGTKPWCSLAAHLSHALVTAWVNDRERQLFAVDLRTGAVAAHAGPWHSRGLEQIVSAPVDFDRAVGVPIGDPEWYLRRPGFARGGIGVAACWWGAIAPLHDVLRAAASADADQLMTAYLGRVDVALWSARAVLVDAARAVDADVSHADKILALRVRSAVADAGELVLSLAERALGPLPLVADEPYARRVADARIYLRQHHADRDLARLGRALAG